MLPPVKKKKRKNNVFDTEIKRLGISLGEDHYQIIQEYAKAHQISMSKVIIDNLQFEHMQQAISLKEK